MGKLCLAGRRLPDSLRHPFNQFLPGLFFYGLQIRRRLADSTAVLHKIHQPVQNHVLFIHKPHKLPQKQQKGKHSHAHQHILIADQLALFIAVRSVNRGHHQQKTQKGPQTNPLFQLMQTDSQHPAFHQLGPDKCLRICNLLFFGLPHLPLI